MGTRFISSVVLDASIGTLTLSGSDLPPILFNLSLLTVTGETVPGGGSATTADTLDSRGARPRPSRTRRPRRPFD